jgi:hypothetical protein
MIIRLELRGEVFNVGRDLLMKGTGTYFDGRLSSGAWKPNSDGVYIWIGY